MGVHGGSISMTPFGSWRGKGQLAAANRPQPDGLYHLSVMGYEHRVADCWLTREELTALRDHLSDLLAGRNRP